MKKYFLALFSFFFSFLNAQNVKPYFQQEVNYKINVSLDDKKHEITADETIEYSNNSPDELIFIWFHLWPNAYKNNTTALAKQLIADGHKEFYFAPPAQRGYIDGLDFKINGQPVKTEPHPEHIDIIKIILNESLKPGEKITITTPFHVKIPIGIFSRLGHIGQQYQITQWYPKPAVYDKYGWHEMPYLNQGEFYSEFGTFDVSISLPQNYVVGATGTLMNEEETAWLMRKVEATKSIESYNPRDTSFPASSSEIKTLRYQASNVHDFAWFADKRYHVLHDEIILPHSKNKVNTWVMFTNLEGKLWNKAVKYVSDAVYYYSLWNGDYPYTDATAVDGALSAGGGMEYPMITVIGQSGSDESLDRVIAHEVGHNWFYGILGSNERDHAWMDEGINSFNENRYMETKYPKDSVTMSMQGNIGGRKVDIGKLLGVPNLNESTLFDLGYRFNAAKKLDQPCDYPSEEYTPINYGAIVYGKTSFLFTYLKTYLGTELYDKCARAYFDEWKFKHPYPDDVQQVYEEVSEKDLDWLFDALIQTTQQLDYKIVSAKKAEDRNIKIKIRNKRKVNSPFSISAMHNGKIISTQWYDGFAGKKEVAFALPGEGGQQTFDLMKIDASNKIPDINRQNNTFKRKGFCKRTEPFNLRMFGVLHNTDKTQLFWAPVMGWNNYNKFMLGAALYNNVLPEKKFEYVLMPMYSFRNKDLAGGASFNYNMHCNKIFQTIRLSLNAERYSYLNEPLVNMNFNKITPQLSFEIKKKHLRSPLRQTISIRQVNVWQEFADANYSFQPPVYRYDTSYVAINNITYMLDNNRKIHPYNFSFNVQQIERIIKLSITANQRITFKKDKKTLDLRFFAGRMLDRTSQGNYYLYASGAQGTHDYTFDHVFLGRSETSGFFSRQFVESEGGMKVYTPLGRTNEWLVSLNIKYSLPGKIPFKFFADFSTFAADGRRPTFIGDPNPPDRILFDAGIYFPIVQDYVDVYIPILVSKDIKEVFYLNNSDLKTPTPEKNDPDKFKRMARMIRFTFNIHKLNPFELVRNLSL